MSNTILIKRSSTANAVPTAGSLAQGELALNLADGNLFYKNSSDQVTVIASNKFVSVTGNVTGNAFFGNGSGLTALTGANVTGTVANATYAISTGSATSATTAGTVTSAAQPNITSVGTLTSVSVTGNISAGNVSATNFTGLASSATVAASANSVAGANVLGQVANALVAGTVYTAAQPNITSVGTLTSLAVTGNISSANITGTHYGAATGLTGIPGANVTGTVPAATVAATVTTAAQPNITSVGTLSSVTVTANVTGGNLITAGQVSATGNITGAYILGNISQATGYSSTKLFNGTSNVDIAVANGSIALNVNGSLIGTVSSTGVAVTGVVSATGTVTGSQFNGSGAGLTAIPGANVTGTVANATYAVSAGSATTAGTVTTAAQPNITSVGTLASLAVTGNTSSGNFIGTLNGSGANVSSISATNISTGTLAQARLANTAVTLGSTALTLGTTVTTVAGLASVTSTSFVGALTGAATTAGTVTTAAQPNITSVGTLSSVTVTANVTGGNLVTAGTVYGKDALITGNLTVDGDVTYINITNLSVQDPVISLGTGPNGAPLVTNDGKDRGELLNYYNTAGAAAQAAFIGYQNLTGKLIAATNVSITNEVVTVNSYGNLVIGGLEGATVSASGNVTGANLVTAGVVFSSAIVANSVTDTRIELGTVAGIIAVTTNGNSTQFLPSGQINLSGASRIAGGTFTGSGITLGSSQTDLFQDRGGAVTVQVGSGGTIASTWTFANNGALSAPGAISAVGNVSGGNITTTGTGSLATLIVSTLANITATTNSTSTTSGALKVAGGAGIVGNVYAGAVYSGGALALTVESTVDGGTY